MSENKNYENLNYERGQVWVDEEKLSTMMLILSNNLFNNGSEYVLCAPVVEESKSVTGVPFYLEGEKVMAECSKISYLEKSKLNEAWLVDNIEGERLQKVEKMVAFLFGLDR